MNVFVGIGRTVRDIDLKYTSNGKALANFTLAIDKQKRDEGADFIDCVAFGKTAETLTEYVEKGTPISITGRLQTRNWEDRDGKKRKTYEVIVNSFSFLPSNKVKNSGNDYVEPKNDFIDQAESVDDFDKLFDDLPM